MSEQGSHSLIVGSGQASRRIACKVTPGVEGAAGLFWLSGFMSDMASTKAIAAQAWAKERGVGATLFDYSGHGASGAAFTDGTIGRWLEEASAVFSTLTRGPQIVVGSSMGGYLALLMLRQFMRASSPDADRIRALLLIAPAWDMTEALMWAKFSPEVRQRIMETGIHEQPSAYAAPYTITRALIEDGRRHLLASDPFDPGRPVVILQGLRDPDVPAEHARGLLTLLRGGHVEMIEIPDGEHRLSRPQDLDLLFGAIGRFA